MSHRALTPHITAISLSTYFFGGAPASRHHRETVCRLTLKPLHKVAVLQSSVVESHLNSPSEGHRGYREVIGLLCHEDHYWRMTAKRQYEP